jgi:enoyl-CoA hydratase
VTDADDTAPFTVTALPEGAVFRIERPGKHNALTRSVLDGLAGCLDELEARRARLLVVTGAGDRAFCAGTDLAELQGLSGEARMAKTVMARALLVRLSRSPVVSVAAINGLAYGGGLELAMACTLRVAAPGVSLSLPEVKLGLLPAYAGTQFLPAIVGPARALEIMLTGRPVPADAACGGGGAAPGPQVSDAGLAAEDAQVRATFDGPNAREGVAAFLEKRAPRFVDD